MLVDSLRLAMIGIVFVFLFLGVLVLIISALGRVLRQHTSTLTPGTTNKLGTNKLGANKLAIDQPVKASHSAECALLGAKQAAVMGASIHYYRQHKIAK